MSDDDDKIEDDLWEIAANYVNNFATDGDDGADDDDGAILPHDGDILALMVTMVIYCHTMVIYWQ